MKKIGKNSVVIGFIIFMSSLFMFIYARRVRQQLYFAQTQPDQDSIKAKSDKYLQIGYILMWTGFGLIFIPLVASIFISINKD